MDGKTKSLNEIRDALGRAPGCLLLVVGPDPDRTAREIAAAWGVEVTSAGAMAADLAATGVGALAASGQALVITDADVLFWSPGISTDPVAALRRIAARRPVGIVWPGFVDGGRAKYSEFGRRDYYDAPLGDALLISARPDAYAGEPTFTLERVGA